MKTDPFRVAFVGTGLLEILGLPEQLSPRILPLLVAGWREFTERESFSPELVVVGPEVAHRPQGLPAVPLWWLTAADLKKSAQELETQIFCLRGETGSTPPEARLLGRSPAICHVRGLLRATARTIHPILLTGENGTGKDLAASVAHGLSARAKQPLVAVNCGAIPPALAESEFFGSVRGAFTGAENREGYCQQAHGGTLFLDEVGELPLEVQAKLLRLLETKELRRVGSGKVETADFRLICATNRHLPTEIQAGRFREDLYFRINVLNIVLPALRDRIEDLPLLSSHFLASETFDLKRPVQLSSQALAKMAEYHWPGNLRQLRNVLLRATLFHDQAELQPGHIDLDY